MFKYFKESLAEFRHVSWPTKKQTRSYLRIVVWVLTAFTIYLMIVGWVFSSALFMIKDLLTK
jgi:preprotein translocase SecE subunit